MRHRPFFIGRVRQNDPVRVFAPHCMGYPPRSNPTPTPRGGLSLGADVSDDRLAAVVDMDVLDGDVLLRRPAASVAIWRVPRAVTLRSVGVSSTRRVAASASPFGPSVSTTTQSNRTWNCPDVGRRVHPVDHFGHAPPSVVAPRH